MWEPWEILTCQARALCKEGSVHVGSVGNCCVEVWNGFPGYESLQLVSKFQVLFANLSTEKLVLSNVQQKLNDRLRSTHTGISVSGITDGFVSLMDAAPS